MKPQHLSCMLHCIVKELRLSHGILYLLQTMFLLKKKFVSLVWSPILVIFWSITGYLQSHRAHGLQIQYVTLVQLESCNITLCKMTRHVI